MEILPNDIYPSINKAEDLKLTIRLNQTHRHHLHQPQPVCIPFQMYDIVMLAFRLFVYYLFVWAFKFLLICAVYNSFNWTMQSCNTRFALLCLCVYVFSCRSLCCYFVYFVSVVVGFSYVVFFCVFIRSNISH